MQIADRMKSIQGSKGFELLKTVKEMRDRGEEVISLGIGQLSQNTYKPIREAGKRAIDEGWTKYSPSAGRAPLRELLSRQAEKDFQIPVSSENIFVGNGCKQVLFCAFQCLCGPGDEVILPAPYWMSYPSLIQLSGAKVKFLPVREDNQFKVQPEDLEEHISKNTKAFLLNSPNNPTGAVYSEQELKALGETLRKFPQVSIMVDAIYDRLVFSKDLAPNLLSLCPDLRDRILNFNGASKSHVMTGWRLGWMLGPKSFIKTVVIFQSQSAGCASSIAQKAFEDASSLCKEELKQTTQKLKHARNILQEGLSEIPGLKLFPSEGAFYLWIGVQNFIGAHKSFKSSKELMEGLLKKEKLLCISGEEFGAPGYLRLSYVVKPEEIKKAVLRMKRFFAQLS